MTILLLLLTVTGQPDSSWQVEYEHVREGLSLMNLTVRDLEYDKQWLFDSFRLKVVSNLMDHPLAVPDYVLQSGRTVHRLTQAADYPAFTCNEIWGRYARPDRYTARDFTAIIKEIFTLTQVHLDRAFKGLSPAEQESLIYTAPSLWSDEGDSLVHGYAGALQKEFGMGVGRGDSLKMTSVLRLSRKIDIFEIHQAGATLAAGLQQALPLIKGLSRPTFPAAPQVDGVVGEVYGTIELAGHGKVVIGGPGHNVYSGDFAAIIDLGGNDIYESRAAGAVGRFSHPVSFVIDLAGDDVYRNHDKLVNQGAALFGAAVLWDLQGDDIYNAFHIAHGAGLFGFGMLIDEQGRDSYQDGYFTQAAGNFGSGILVDRSGDDIYHSYNWTQGLGGPWGYGLLVDDEGDDVYYAGGQYLHLPLDPDQYRSFAQGFGFGWRDVASGGIGFLCDRAGNDKYIGEVYAQATSYWYALGILLDEQGNDLYSAAQYSQGAGIHLSVGGLFDLEGDDHYFSRFGPAQGEGHDLAVGWLWDKDGDDVYYASGGQGIGLTNSVGIFIDSRGNDDYTSRQDLSEGGANWARGTGGIGLFVDLQGDDRYAEKDKGANNHVWTSGTVALGMDLEALAPMVETWEDTTAVFPELDTMKTDSAKMAQLFHYASLWQVRADIGKVKTARRMLREQYGVKAVKYVYEREFATYDGLAYEAFEDLFKAFRDSAAVYLFKGLHDKRDTVIRNSIYFLGRLKAAGTGDTLTRMLAKISNDTLAGLLITALGTIKETRAIPHIIKYAHHFKERMRLRVAVALGELADSAGISTLLAQIYDPSFIVKTAASASLALIGGSTIAPLEKALASANTDAHRTIVLKTLRDVYRQLPGAHRTTELRDRLARLVRVYLDSGYPALHRETEGFIDEIEGRRVLSPTEMFLLPQPLKE